MSSIFISYRRSDSSAWAILFYKSLRQHFSESQIFFDAERIHIGGWKEQIKNNIDSSRVMIILIGENWIDPRLTEYDDVHRFEIREALKKQILIIPVVLPDSKLPVKDELPDDIQQILDYEAVFVSHKEELRENQLLALKDQIQEIVGIKEKIEPKTYFFYVLAFVVISSIIYAFLPSSENFKSMRVRWESSYQKSYEMLDTNIFKNKKEEIMVLLKENPNADKGVIVLDFLKKKIEESDEAQTLVPQYVDFYEELLSLCNDVSCNNKYFNKVFKDKVLEFWSNYKCYINTLRGKGYPNSYAKNIERFYENSEEILIRREIINKNRKVQVTNGLQLCTH